MYREGTIIGFDPSYDLAVLKVDVEGYELKPATLGTSRELHVGQSCFAIGNPYGYENTLTTGVVSGLGREIPSPNGRAIRFQESNPLFPLSILLLLLLLLLFYDGQELLPAHAGFITFLGF